MQVMPRDACKTALPASAGYACCLLAAALVLPGSLTATPVTLSCEHSERMLAIDGGDLYISLENSQAPTLLVINEEGLPLYVVSDAGTEQRRLPVPPRLGRITLRNASEAQLALPAGRSTGSARVQVLCNPEQVAQQWRWMEQAANLSEQLAQGVGSLEYAAVTSMLETLQEQAAEPDLQAWALHLRAQSLLMAGHSQLAAPAFLVAAEAWEALGDSARAGAARVAAAEDMNRYGDYHGVLQLSLESESTSSADRYYDVRLRNAGCLALRYLGRLDEAAQCYAQTTGQLHALEESLELAVTTLDFGTIELDRGNLDSATDLFQRSFQVAGDIHEGSLGVYTRFDRLDALARAEFFLADAQARSGRMGLAMAHLQRAMLQFDESGSVRWMGSASLRLGGLLTELGATTDARTAIVQGMAQFDVEHAPARIAAAHMALARLALRDADGTEAESQAERASVLYGGLSMPLEKAQADELRVRAALLQSKQTLAQELAASLPSSDAEPGTQALLRMELALAAADFEASAAALAKLQPARLSLLDRARAQGVQVELARAQGNQQAALQMLREYRDEWLLMAAQVGSAALRERLEHFSADIASQAIDILVADLPDTEVALPLQDIERWSEWLVLPTSAAVTDTSARDRAATDAALAAALFPGVTGQHSSDGAAVQAVLDALVAPDRSLPSMPNKPSHLRSEDLMALLGRDDHLLLLLDGRRHVALIHLTQQQATVRAVAERRQLVRDIQALRTQLLRADSAAAEAYKAARVLGKQLLPSVQQWPTEGRLLVLPSGALGGVPWPALADASAMQQVALTLLVPGQQRAAGAHGPPDGLHFLAAAQEDSGTLPSLAAASYEAGWIAQALPGTTLHVDQSATRESMLAALETRNTWVHVAAHGTLAPARIGGMGLWLNPLPGESVPQYLSWLELPDRNVQAELVVLNACQLGGDGQGNYGMIGFSTALLRAGAGQVIAAQWPVSDTASAIWIRALYGRLHDAQTTPAHALAEARNALQRSRAFRHPHYWAGLSHFEVIATTPASQASSTE